MEHNDQEIKKDLFYKKILIFVILFFLLMTAFLLLSSLSKLSYAQNNFIENDLHACFDTAFRNHWLRNYWEGDILPPARIDGMISFYKTDYWGNIIWELHIPWVNFDWLPEITPYDIKV